MVGKSNLSALPQIARVSILLHCGQQRMQTYFRAEKDGRSVCIQLIFLCYSLRFDATLLVEVLTIGGLRRATLARPGVADN
jgi:hypothetical protein